MLNNFQIILIALFFSIFIVLTLISENLRFGFISFLKFELTILISLILIHYLTFIWTIFTNIIYSLLGSLIFVSAAFPISNLSLILLNFFLTSQYIILKKIALKEPFILIIIIINTSFLMVLMNYLFLLDLYGQWFHFSTLKLKTWKTLFGLFFIFNLLNIGLNCLLYFLFYFLPFKPYSNNYHQIR